MKYLIICLLSLGACTAPQANTKQASTGFFGGSVKAPVIPDNYQQWLDGLPSQENEASKPFQADFAGKMVLDIAQEGVQVEVQISGSVEYADLRHFREIVEFHVDLGDLPGKMPMGPFRVSLHMNADGESLHVSPNFHQDWLYAMIQSANMGFEKMVFTLDLDTLEEMLAVYWEYFDNADIDLAGLLPEGMSTEEFFSRGINPAAWARLYLLTADISNFRVDSGEVHVTAKLKDEWMNGMMMADPNARAMMEDMSYEICFDRYSGIPTSMGLSLKADGFSMNGSIEFLDFMVGDGLFPSDHFQHESTQGRTLFPVDTFMQMGLGAMQGQMEEDDEDIPF